MAIKSARVAQLVEHTTENRSVGGSIPPPGTTLSLEIVAAIQRCLHRALAMMLDHYVIKIKVSRRHGKEIW